jgi:hypothetical protein
MAVLLIRPHTLYILTYDANLSRNTIMDPTKLVIAPEAYNAWLLGNVIAATVPRGETSAEAHTRSGAIIEMFKCFAPRDAVEAMVASHCVHLQLLSQGAMRDAASTSLDAKTLKGMRASAMTVSGRCIFGSRNLKRCWLVTTSLPPNPGKAPNPEQPRRRPAEELRRSAEAVRKPAQETNSAEPANAPPRVGPVASPAPARPPPRDPFAQPVFAARPLDQPRPAAATPPTAHPDGATPRTAPGLRPVPRPWPRIAAGAMLGETDGTAQNADLQRHDRHRDEHFLAHAYQRRRL